MRSIPAQAMPVRAFCKNVMPLTTGEMPALNAMLADVLFFRNGKIVCSTCAAQTARSTYH